MKENMYSVEMRGNAGYGYYEMGVKTVNPKCKYNTTNLYFLKLDHITLKRERKVYLEGIKTFYWR